MSALTVGVLVRVSVVVGRVILDDSSVDAVAQTFVHVHCDLIGHSHKQVDEEALFSTNARLNKRISL